MTRCGFFLSSGHTQWCSGFWAQGPLWNVGDRTRPSHFQGKSLILWNILPAQYVTLEVLLPPQVLLQMQMSLGSAMLQGHPYISGGLVRIRRAWVRTYPSALRYGRGEQMGDSHWASIHQWETLARVWSSLTMALSWLLAPPPGLFSALGKIP